MQFEDLIVRHTSHRYRLTIAAASFAMSLCSPGLGRAQSWTTCQQLFSGTIECSTVNPSTWPQPSIDINAYGRGAEEARRQNYMEQQQNLMLEQQRLILEQQRLIREQQQRMAR